jgi:aromatic-L-amino-acid/L-tryptophan decarboxylase
MSDEGFHLPADYFRSQGHELIDWIANYLENAGEYPVLSQVAPGSIRSQLPKTAPLKGESFDEVMSDVNDIIMPGITHWQSPDFYAYFPANTSGPSILGELLASGLGVQGMIWATSPACTELETQVVDWLRQAIGLSERFSPDGEGGGVIQDSASGAALVALLAARDRKSTGKEVVYISDQTHSSIEKGVRIARIPHLRKIETDVAFALRPEKLAETIADDVAAGLTPAFVCATLGTTSSLAMDPVRAIAEVAAAAGCWLHVDAAMAGSALICPEYRNDADGIDLADSVCFNAHKWLFTNFDCSLMFLADREPVLASLSILPEYLRNEASESGAVIDYRDWQVPLGRRFRALKLWMVVRHYGIEGLQHHVREHVRLAESLAGRIEQDDRFVLLQPQHLNLVLFRLKAGEEPTRQLMDTVNSSGDAYLTHTVLAGEYWVRVAVGATSTTAAHVDALWRLFDRLAG